MSSAATVLSEASTVFAFEEDNSDPDQLLSAGAVIATQQK
jgi:hypothetical protein